MSNQQIPLGLQPVQAPSFEDVIGHRSEIHSLQQDPLPPFIYLWGAACSGKTHLLQAIKVRLEQRNWQVLFFGADALKEVGVLNVLPAGLQCLLVDDVDQLAGGDESELALFNVYNHCRNEQCTLILSSSLASRDLAWRLPDLKSRLTSGLQLSLSVLSGPEAWLAFETLFKRHGMRLDEAVLSYLQARFSSGFADLYDLFLRLSAESLRQKKRVTVPMVKLVLESV